MNSYTYKSLKPFSLISEWRQSKIVKVYDGDTIHFSWEVDGKPYRFSGRVLHVNTAELRTKCSHEKQMAVLARDRVKELVLNQVVLVKPQERKDKYGRELIEVKCGGELLSDILITDNLALPYSGREKFAEVIVRTGYVGCQGTRVENCQMWRDVCAIHNLV